MSRRKELPTMLGHYLHKGLLLSPNKKMGGYDMVIVWLDDKKDIESGDTFEPEDVVDVDRVIHFCDKESVRTTIQALEMILDEMEQTDDR